MVKKYAYGFLILVVLMSSIYLLLPDQIRIDIEKTRSQYKVYEDNSWVLAATEYINLFDGNKKMRAKDRSLEWSESEGIITAIRIANYKDSISTKETYVFDSGISSVELVPLSHETECVNCVGKILQFEVRNILYDGQTKDISSPFSFGHSMKLTWQDGAYRAKVYQQKVASDKIIIRYRPTNNYQVFLTRLFDPPSSSDAGINVTILFPVNNTFLVVNNLDLNWTVNITANTSFYSLDGGANNSDIFVSGASVNITFRNLTEGNHNITIYVNDSSGNLAQSDLINFSTRPPLNVSLNTNLTGLSYNINWSKTDINYSDPGFFAGNFTWNFTDFNTSVYPTLPYVYNITNTRVDSVTVSVNISRIAVYFNWTYNDTDIGLSRSDLFVLLPNQSKLINFSLSVVNISVTLVNWSATIYRANWTFVPTFVDTEV